MSSTKKDNNVSVGVRIRPRNEKEITAEMPVFFTPSGDGSAVQELDENGKILKHWYYDHVFGPNCSNTDVFETMGSKLVDAAMEGYNTVMFMYGQTSSGKTFTLFGGANIAGVVQHAMEHVYNRVKSSTDTEYVIKLTYAELYNEEIKDLLSPTPNENLKIIEDPNLGPLIQNITEANFTSAADVKAILEEGENRRHFGVTNMNAHSSRSHVIVRLNIEARKIVGKTTNPLRQSWGKDRPSCVSTLNLVDLAGSERANKAGTTGQSLKEGSFINKSLLTLGTVISNLSEGKLQHIPYRNSKLTRLLATALGGNAKTCVITCISPASGNVAESLNTLRFAARAKRIVNHVHKNEIMDMKSLTGKLAIQMAEIEQLRNQLDVSRQLGYCPDDDTNGESLRDKALYASKNLRAVRFMLNNGATIINGLREKGMIQLAQKVPSDIRDVVLGTRDSDEILENYSNIINTYLPTNRKLMSKIHDAVMQNESDAIVSVHDSSGALSDDEEETSEEDLFNSLENGGEAAREQLNAALFYAEDTRSIATRYIDKVQQELSECLAREKSTRKNFDDSQKNLVEQLETVRNLRISENSLNRQIEELKGQWKADLTANTQQVQQLTTQIGDLEIEIADKDTTLLVKQHEIQDKDKEIEKLRGQVDQLTKDLNGAIASKKAFEDEAARQRNDLRIQMDRLRNNMHEMLLQGGEENKVVESHNAQLQKELDVSKDEINVLTQTKEQLDIELSQLRAQIATLHDGLMSHDQTIVSLRDENTELQQRTRDLRLDITKLTASLAFAEKANEQYQYQLQIEIKAKEDTIETKEKEMELLKAKTRSKMNDIQIELDIKDAEIESLKDQLNSKGLFVTKIEQSLNNDIARLEKKLAAQTKLYEEISLQCTNTTVQAHATYLKHQEEVKTLKQKLQEQQTIIDSINNYIERQEKELIDDYCSPQCDEDTTSIWGSSPRHNSWTPKQHHHNNSTFFNDTDDVSLYSLQRTDSFRSSSMNNMNMNRVHSSTLSVYTTMEEEEEGKDSPSPSLSILSKSSPNVGYSYSSSSEPYHNIKKSPNKTSNKYSLLDYDKEQQDASQITFESILYGLQLSTTWMEHTIREEKLLRTQLINHTMKTKRQQNQTIYSISELNDEKELLTEQQYHLQKSLEFSNDKFHSVQTRLTSLQKEYEELSKEYYRTVKSEQISIAQMNKMEQAVMDMKLQNDKINVFLTHNQNDLQELKYKNLQLQHNIEECNENYYALQTRYDLVHQEKDILIVERDELMKRFLPSYAASRKVN